MKRMIIVAAGAMLLTSNAYAESIVAESCSDSELLTNTLKKTDSASTISATLSSLIKSCPENALTIMELAYSLQPELAKEIAAATVQNVPAEVAESVVQRMIELAPDGQAQDIVDAIAETGALPSEDIVVAAISGGADPTTIAQPTAAGAPAAGLPGGPAGGLVSIPGANTGNGAGGGGGGGTASQN